MNGVSIRSGDNELLIGQLSDKINDVGRRGFIRVVVSRCGSLHNVVHCNTLRDEIPDVCAGMIDAVITPASKIDDDNFIIEAFGNNVGNVDLI